MKLRIGAAGLTALVGLTSAAGLVGLAAAAGATTRDPAVSETYVVPATGVLSIEGHGSGHGHGLSQWGAQGAAVHGVSAATILSTYYPGTASTTLTPRTLRVFISEDDGRDLQVAAAAGMTVTDLATGHAMTLPAGPARWRAVPDGSGEHLESLTGSTWTRVALAGTTVQAGPLSFARAGSTVPVVLPDGSTREYRGSVSAPRNGSGLLTVDTILVDDYLLSVVPSEAYASWAPAALQAQAVAARTYAIYEKTHAWSGSAYDICDSSACQAFSGTRVRYAGGGGREYEYASTTAAVQATAGQVRTYQGQPAFTQFSASNGGWTADGGQPYLQAKVDPWDGWANSYPHSWTATLSAAELHASYPSLGTVQRLTVTARDGHGDWGGRVLTVVLQGTANGRPTTLTTSGQSIAWAAGFMSNWWHVVGAPVTTPSPTHSPTPSPRPTPTPTHTPTATPGPPRWRGAWGGPDTASPSTAVSRPAFQQKHFGVAR